MIVEAKAPENEAERLERLLSYGILDTAPTDAFDRITRLIVDLLDVPTGIITFIDSDRQWYKSKIGIDIDEVPRAFSFCQHALDGSDLMVVPDARQDPRFASHPAVVGDLNIRFYVSAAIMTTDRLPIGTICALDSEPRTLTEHERQRMVDLAGLVMDQLELGQAKLLAERSNLAKSEFLAVVSHELRTPLNAIIGFSEMIRNEMFGVIGNPKYVEYADHVAVSGRHLLALINDILDLSKIDAGEHHLTIEPFEIGPEILEVSGYIQAKTGQPKQRDVVCRIADDATVLYADLRAFRQAVINILANADRHSPTEAPITIEVLRDQTGATVVAIGDQGSGIAPEHLDRVLEPFAQIRDSNSMYGKSKRAEGAGTGLGLAITRSLMLLHGGQIKIESHVGVGTTVSLIFPNRPDLTPLS